MNGNIIDTNVIIKLLGGDEHAAEIFAGNENISVPVIVAGELFYGAYKSTRKEENMKLFADFLSNYPLLPVNGEIAVLYGEIKTNLLKNGFTIPENDIWIAATAKAYRCVLITFDSHFDSIEGLNILR